LLHAVGVTAHLPCLQITVAADACTAQQQATVKTMRLVTQLIIVWQHKASSNV